MLEDCDGSGTCGLVPFSDLEEKLTFDGVQDLKVGGLARQSGKPERARRLVPGAFDGGERRWTERQPSPKGPDMKSDRELVHVASSLVVQGKNFCGCQGKFA